jgi:3-oxoacyl-[acyl-carrier protein] reductase
MNEPPASSGVVLITGAAGGLGQGLVRAFAANGWRVVAAYHRQPGQLASEPCWPVRLDVTSRTEAREVVAQVVARWGRLDALVNNAGLALDKVLGQMKDEDWQRVLAVNLTGAFHCVQAVLPHLLNQEDGHILNIASFSARSGPRGQANYAAAKAGLIGFTASLAREVGARNVRVNAVLPGVLPTPMTARLGESALAELAVANALGRINTIEEVARFAAFLASLRNVSGQVFQLDSRIARWT